MKKVGKTKAIRLWEFPVPSTDLCGGDGVRLIYPGGNAWLVFGYYDLERDEYFHSGLKFECVQGLRHMCEKFCEGEKSKASADFILQSYDCLVEYVDSEWVRYYRHIDQKTSDYWNIKHFGIYLDSEGFYEFIARGFSVLEERKGVLDEFQDTE